MSECLSPHPLKLPEILEVLRRQDFLTDHLGFIAAEAANPVLAEALSFALLQG